MDTKKNYNLPGGPKRIAQKLEYNLYFYKAINKLHNSGGKINLKMLYDLRKDLKDRKIADLSPFWDDFLAKKIEFPKMKLSKILAGASVILIKTNKFGEKINYIEIYPETSKRDVLRSFKVILKDQKTVKCQPIKEKNILLYDAVFEGAVLELNRQEIIQMAKNKTEHVKNYTVDEKLIDKIITEIKKGS